jgi:C1A family cysteine protease
MKSIVALLLGVAAAWDKEYTMDEVHAMDTMASFKAWSSAFERNYASVEEESHRYLVWLDNLYTIASYNSGDLTFKLRMNQFGDMTHDEFRRYVHGDNGACFDNRDEIVNANGQDIMLVDTPPVNAPASVDWTTKGVVTPVKNQGQCGSCWAFSATGAIECDYAIKYGTLNSLSEQQLVDCAGIAYGCQGCNGGQMTGAMRYAASDGGLCSEKEYPYTAKDGTCKASSCGTKYDKNAGYSAVTRDSETALESATALGCVSVGIEADQVAFQYYSSGVLTGNCGTNIDHGVLVVGYGTSGSQDYWKVKNSWGTSWGEQGYVLICRNCNKNGNAGECGILTEPNVPTF